MDTAQPTSYQFAGYRVDATTRSVTAPDGRPIALTARAFDALLMFVRHPGELLDKETLLGALWPGRIVEENNLNQVISALRHALGDNRRERHVIETDPGRGYRFVAAVKIAPDHAAEQDTPTGTGNLAAHKLYLTGRHRMDKARADTIAEAIGLFREAIELDPVYALAWGALAEAHRRLPLVGDVAPLDAFPLARAAARKALTIDPELALAHANLGWVAFWHDWDWSASEQHFRHAIALAPNVAEAHLGLAHLLTNLGRFADAAEPAATAARLDPFSPIIATITASFAGAAGATADARARLDDVIAEQPQFWVAILHRAELSLLQGDADAALADLRLANERSHGRMQVLGPLGYTLAQQGDTGAARALLAELQSRSEGFVPPTTLAMIHAGLGNTERALDELDRALGVRDVRLTFLKRDAAWRNLRHQPRFIALAHTLGLD